MCRAVSQLSCDFAEAPQLEAVRDYDCMLCLRRQMRQDVSLGIDRAGTTKLSEVVMQESVQLSSVAPRGRRVKLDLKGL